MARHEFTDEQRRRGGKKRAAEMWAEHRRLKEEARQSRRGREVSSGGTDGVWTDHTVIPVPDALPAPCRPDPHQAAALAYPPGVWHPDPEVRRQSGIEPAEDEEGQGERPEV